MAILQECPICRTRQSLKRRVCTHCSQNLETSKRSGNVNFWIQYRLPDKKQVFQKIGNSLDEAKIEEGKIRKEKKEGTLSDAYRNKMTFNQLSVWYLNLEKVKWTHMSRQKRVEFKMVTDRFAAEWHCPNF